MILESYFYLWLSHSACISMLLAKASYQTKQAISGKCCAQNQCQGLNIYTLRVKSLFRFFLAGVLILFLKQVGGRNTVLERAFVRNGVPFVSEVPIIIFRADVTHPPPGEDSASSICVGRGTMQLCSLHPCCVSR